jgi:hypothetical protein
VQREEANIARSGTPVPPQSQPLPYRREAPTGGNGAHPPASAGLSLGFSLLRLTVSTRLAIGGFAVFLVWLCIAWVLA